MDDRVPGGPGRIQGGPQTMTGEPYIPQQGTPIGDVRPVGPPPGTGYMPPPPANWPAPTGHYMPYLPVGIPVYGSQPMPSPIAVGLDPPAYEGPGEPTSAPAAVVAVRSLNPWQGAHTAAPSRPLHTWLFAAFLFLFTLCGMMAFEWAYLETREPPVAECLVATIALLAPLLMVAGWVVRCVGINRQRVRRLPRRMEDPTVYTLAFYEDRVVKTMPHAQLTMRYMDIRDMRETRTQIRLDDGGLTIVLRAEDLTAFDAQVVATLLYRHIPPQRRQFMGAFFPQRRMPLDIPCYPETAPLCEVEYRPSAPRRGIGVMLLRSSPYWVAGVLSAAGLAAQMLGVTGNVLVDFGLFAAGGALAVALLTVGFAALVPCPAQPLPERTRLVFQQEGLTWLCGDSAPFIPRGHCRVTRDARAARIETPLGTAVLPWEQLDQRDAVQRFLFGS